MTVTRRHADRVAGLLLAGLGAYITTEALGWDIATASGPGPGFFPLIYGTAMTVLSLLLVIRSVSGSAGEGAERPALPGAGRALAVWAILVAGILLLPVLGFDLVVAALMLVVGIGVYRRPPKTVVIAAASVAAGFHLIFVLALGVDLPTGLLGF